MTLLRMTSEGTIWAICCFCVANGRLIITCVRKDIAKLLRAAGHFRKKGNKFSGLALLLCGLSSCMQAGLGAKQVPRHKMLALSLPSPPLSLSWGQEEEGLSFHPAVHLVAFSSPTKTEGGEGKSKLSALSSASEISASIIICQFAQGDLVCASETKPCSLSFWVILWLNYRFSLVHILLSA